MATSNKYAVDFSPVTDAVSTLMSAKQKAREFDVTSQQNQQQIDIDKGTLAVNQQNADTSRLNAQTSAGQLTLAQQQLKAETPLTEQNFGVDKVAMFSKALTTQGLEKAFAPILEPMTEMANDDKYTNREVYKHYKGNWNIYKDSIQQNLLAEYQKERDPIRSQKILSLMKEIAEDKDGSIIDQAMPATAELIGNEQISAASKLKNQSTTNLGKLIAERDSLASDDPNISIYDAAIAKETGQTQEDEADENMLNYWASLYETTGQMPSFGMGTKAANQRQAFMKIVAQRALERGEGEDGAKQAVRQATFKANQSTLTDLTKRENLINSFKTRIDETSEKVLEPLIKKWDLQNPRFVNWTVNKLAEVMGSGDLASLKLALNSVSAEVGKVEFNALGIQQLSESATDFMNSVHDPNMKVSELLKVIETSKKLGQTGLDAIKNQKEALVNEIGDINTGGNQTPTPKTQAEYDSLPSGTIYIDPDDGKQYRKP